MVSPTGAQAPIVALPTRAGEIRQIAGGAMRHLGGRWLSDGKRIVFAGAAGSRLRYYEQDAPDAAPRPISGENIDYDRGDPIVISPDDQWLATAIAGEGIRLLPVAGGDARPLPGETKGLHPLAWCGASLLASRPFEIPAHVIRIDLQSGKQTLWKDLVPADRTALSMVAPIRVAADCETYAYSAQYDPSVLWVLGLGR